MKSNYFNFQNNCSQLPVLLYQKSIPAVVCAPKIMLFNEVLAAELGVDFSALKPEELAQILSGNVIPKDTVPYSQAYAGHQFGRFTVLGDGRAHILGEHLTPDGRCVDIAFKGSGQTPFSRRGDGKAALGPMLREYIVSEAMHALGIPTTRGLAVVATGEKVIRESRLPGAVLTRVADSHIRVGTFEYLAYQRDDAAVTALCKYAVNKHYPELVDSYSPLAFLRAVMLRQIALITNWMRVGFIHGVMNTDNMLISGDTIDYGPCAFMDAYDPSAVFSAIDHQGRYAYKNQPIIAQWNLARLAEVLLPQIDKNIDNAVDIASGVINEFPALYEVSYIKMMSEKIGIKHQKPGDDELVAELLTWMDNNKADYTNTFFELSSGRSLSQSLLANDAFMMWHARWQDRLKQEMTSSDEQIDLMRQVNPAVIPRNHQIERVLEAAAQENFEPLSALVRVLGAPYEYKKDVSLYQLAPLPNERVRQTFCGT